VAGPIETSLQIEDTAAAWVAKRESGDWGVDDQASLDAWLSASTAHRVAFLRLHAAWDRLSRLSSLGAVAGGIPNEPLSEAPSTTSKIGITPSEPAEAPFVAAGRSPAKLRTGPNRRYALAAGLIAAFTAGILWYLTNNDRGIPYETKIGEIFNVSLPDGTTAVIDSASKMTVRMDGRERHIELERGAIFLNVAKDSVRPFVVDAGDKRLTDEGTQFSVRRESNELVVLVADGKVYLEAPGSQSAAQAQAHIDAGSEAHASGLTIDVQPLSEIRMQEQLSWRTGHLVFHDTALPDAVAAFNRYSERRIVIQGPSLADIRIGGSFRATDIEGFLSLLRRGFPVQVDETNAAITLTRR
jgi:transmembrane sensor